MQPPSAGHRVDALRCAVCSTRVDIAAAEPWQCPRRTADDPHHVLHLVVGDEHGIEWVGARLHEWLSESADVGGDDVTMGLLVAEIDDVEVADVVGPDDETTAVMPGAAPARNLSSADFDASTLRPVARRRPWRAVVLVAVSLAVAVGAVAVALLVI